MPTSLPVISNLAEAHFECIFGRGCDGLCCQNGRPATYPEDSAMIDRALARALPHLRPEARALIEKEGYLSRRTKLDQPMLRVVGGWCVFFNEGCVLHKVGAAEGDAYKYKPILCSVFPLNPRDDGSWYVRQWGYEKEPWDLFCLNPAASPRLASEALRDEVKALQKRLAQVRRRIKSEGGDGPTGYGGLC